MIIKIKIGCENIIQQQQENFDTIYIIKWKMTKIQTLGMKIIILIKYLYITFQDFFFIIILK